MDDAPHTELVALPAVRERIVEELGAKAGSTTSEPNATQAQGVSNH